MEIIINNNGERIPATLEVVDGVMIVSPKEEKVDITQFKDGDIITCGWDGKNRGYSWTCILCEEIDQIADNMYIAYYCYIDCNGEYSCENGASDSATWVRYATEDEKQKLFDTLAKEGKAWDAERKAVVELKWKPFKGECYCAPSLSESLSFFAYIFKWTDSHYDNNIYNIGWCFKTKEECEAYCQRLNQAINNIKP